MATTSSRNRSEGSPTSPAVGEVAAAVGAPQALRAPEGNGLDARLAAYYTRYYRDALGIPGWRDLVRVRVAEADYEGRRLARLERALGRPVTGLVALNVGCGTGGWNAAARSAGARVSGVDTDAEAVAIAHERPGGSGVTLAAAESLPFG